MASTRQAPPLPPRQRSSTSNMDEPPPYEAIAGQQKAYEKATSAPAGLRHDDPRSSSQDSLAPEEQNQRRKLLLVYIHGFMGNETSFRSFPAHVHNLLVVLLAETHVVHTKVYPRYQSRGKITLARDDFSKWMEPHQDQSTDVVLLGHSMGGLLSAEVALAPATPPANRPFRHRIIGTINFDVPFLGMHPGVVKSGLASIFKPADTPQDQFQPTDGSEGASTGGETSPARSPNRMGTLYDRQDPNYNPSFANDVTLPVRKGWRNAWHFISKHSDDLTTATKKLVSSHLEFGGAMANYSELKSRYARLRALEESDERVRQSVVQGGIPPRIRFVNYYTASTGRPRNPKSPQRHLSRSPHGSRPTSRASGSRASLRPEDLDIHASRIPRNSIEQHLDQAMESMTITDTATNNSTARSGLPPRPGPLDVSFIQDVEVKKVVEQEHAKAVEAYEDALKQKGDAGTPHKASLASSAKKQPSRGRQPAPRPPKPETEMTHSEREALRLEKERQRMEREGRRLRGESSPVEVPEVVTPAARPSSPRPSTVTSTKETSDSTSLAPADSKDESPHKPKKDRKFCSLPPKDSNGERDPCWVRIFMENVDEVGAHCGLFYIDERYERLVGDVASRVETWVNDQNDLRMLGMLEGENPKV